MNEGVSNHVSKFKPLKPLNNLPLRLELAKASVKILTVQLQLNNGNNAEITVIGRAARLSICIPDVKLNSVKNISSQMFSPPSDSVQVSTVSVLSPSSVPLTASETIAQMAEAIIDNNSSTNGSYLDPADKAMRSQGLTCSLLAEQKFTQEYRLNDEVILGILVLIQTPPTMKVVSGFWASEFTCKSPPQQFLQDPKYDTLIIPHCVPCGDTEHWVLIQIDRPFQNRPVLGLGQSLRDTPRVKKSCGEDARQVQRVIPRALSVPRHELSSPG